ncbi:MAG: hypothetical protein FIB02_11115 [Desulfuromonas sp.]|nr:hypothetical protein [Desulfuromonas sp.]
MNRLLPIVLTLVMLPAIAACPARMAPFAPHRTNTDFHRTAQNNQACLGCHEVKTIRIAHQPSDDCLKCHRILQGE